MARNYGLLLDRSNRQRYRGRKAECAERKVQKEALGGNERMEIKITGKPEEIEKLFNAIGGSKEQLIKIDANTAFLKKLKPMNPKVYRRKLEGVLKTNRSNDDNSDTKN